jgi:hypothetical protein
MPEPYNSLEAKPWQPVSSIPLAEAALCGNCQCIVIAKNGHCPVCESLAIVNLSALLERRGAVVDAVDTKALADATGEP